MMPRQTGQGNTAKRKIPMNGLNPTTESVLPVLPKNELRTGAETSLAEIPLELAGKKLEVVAQQVERIFKQEFRNFSESELKNLVNVTIEVVRENDLRPNTDLTLIAREIQSRTMPFTQEAAQLLTRALERMWEVLNSPDTSDNDSNNNFPGFGSTPTSSGSALAA